MAEENINKEIVALSDVEHVRLRTGMYVGATEEIEENCRIIKDGVIMQEKKMISTGFYKLLNEIVDNSFDEAKRNPSKKCTITVSFDTKTNKVTVSDTGGGFLNASAINSKTGKTNVETALSNLRAGSNFTNDNINATILGTNGVGASCVNMLSDEFEVTTTNDKEVYHQKWTDFKSSGPEIRKKKGTDQKGTIISFIPLKSIFKKCKWDYDYVVSQMVFREYVRASDPLTKNVTFKMFWDDSEVDLTQNFIPEDAFSINTKLGTLHIWKYQEGMFQQTGFVNTALCIGTHMNIFQDFMNELFDYNRSWLYWCCVVTLNLPPKLVKFDDQNKRKLVSGRWEVEPEMEKHFLNQVKREFKKTDMYKDIKDRIEEEKKKDDTKEMKRQMRAVKKRLISDKYFPPSCNKKTLLICEGSSAGGSLLQKRDPKTDGVYMLRGKIKNAKSVKDLASNREICELMNILDIGPDDDKHCAFEKIYIATDWDPDGIGHIASLVTNLFSKWFPNVIDQDKLFILSTPLVSVDVAKQRKYFYSMKDFAEYTSTTSDKYTNTRYLKGLGSLSLQDWEAIMEYKDGFRVYRDKSAKKMLYVAFDAPSKYRKKWLEGTL